MNESTDRLDAMRDRFPRVFKGAQLPWGLECGPGWDELLVDLLAQLDAILAKHPTLRFRLVQIKEKFGSLRFYVSFDEGTEDDIAQKDLVKVVFAAIQDAQKKSARTCERCGTPSVIREIGSVATTVCPKCRGE